jgi:FkbM family methyltransferase
MNPNWRKFLKKVPIVGPFCKILNKALLYLKKPLLIPARQLKWRLRGEQNLTVLQIGSNDGLATDPLHDLLIKNKDWKAILVEPVPSLFNKLKNTYLGRDNTFFLNVAVSDKNQFTNFYFLDDVPKELRTNFPDWYDQLGSFNKNHIISHLGFGVDKYIKTILIETVCLATLLKSCAIKKLDVLHIDTEGHDWIILKQLDLNKISPKIILFENKHLSTMDVSEFYEKYQSRYSIINLGTDYLCQLKK